MISQIKIFKTPFTQNADDLNDHLGKIQNTINEFGKKNEILQITTTFETNIAGMIYIITVLYNDR